MKAPRIVETVVKKCSECTYFDHIYQPTLNKTLQEKVFQCFLTKDKIKDPQDIADTCPLRILNPRGEYR